MKKVIDWYREKLLNEVDSEREMTKLLKWKGIRIGRDALNIVQCLRVVKYIRQIKSYS